MKKSQTIITEKEQAAIDALLSAVKQLPKSIALELNQWTGSIVIYKRVGWDKSPNGLHQVGKITKRSIRL